MNITMNLYSHVWRKIVRIRIIDFKAIAPYTFTE